MANCPFVWVQQATSQENEVASKQERGVTAYFVESSAANNVDDLMEWYAPTQKWVTTKPTPLNNPEDPWKWIETDKALDQIARTLVEARADNITPRLVISVHGFNNPPQVVAGRLASAHDFVRTDSVMTEAKGVVCIGYRWPSEKAPDGPKDTLYEAMPGAIRGPLMAALTVIAAGLGAKIAGFSWWRALVACGLFVAGLPAAAAALRLIVYYRDNYRATHYGVTDLVEFIRQVDDRAKRILQEEHPKLLKDGRLTTRRIELSFIGHSMGAFVVTQTVRILSDVFDPSALDSAKATREGKFERVNPRVGHVFLFANLVLVSPDIPAEALMMRRANFLSSSLHRFRQVYLFSSGADVVLDIVSSLANYFSFPNRDRAFGHRLGNVQVAASGNTGGYGIMNLGRSEMPVEEFLQGLQLGGQTLFKLHQDLHKRKEEPGDSAQSKGSKEANPSQAPIHLSVFDCTDSTALRGSGAGTLGTLKKWKLLGRYIGKSDPDVHSGYFNAGLKSQELIYRLATLGIHGAVGLKAQEHLSASAWKGKMDELSRECAESRMRVLMAPRSFVVAENPPEAETLAPPPEPANPENQ